MSSVPENTQSVSTTAAQQLWRTAVAYAAAKARQALPDVGARLDRAVELVFSDAVELRDDGTARVTSRTATGTTYDIANGTCTCKDHPHAPDGWCLHRLARALTVKALQIAKELEATPAQTVAVAPQPGIPNEFIVQIQGKPFILYHGLLQLAHSQGLLSLHVEFTQVTDTYALAKATVQMHDGRVFSECGDSTPENVGVRVKPAWRRMALTRAKARVLRDALNISMVAVEELENH